MISILTHIVKKSAENFPEGEAYTDGTERITFKQLDQKSSQLAKCLIELGVGKGDRIGIYLPRCIESVISVYGIMKAGAVFVPLDPLAPVSRVKFLLEDCSIKVLVSSKSQTKKIAKILDGSVSLQTLIGVQSDDLSHISWESIYNQSVAKFEFPEVLAADLAYIMYTSGSTGVPKGIMHTHGSGLNYALLSARLYNLQPEDRVAGHAPLHFDISTFSYFTAPLAGACTVIIPEAYTKVPASLSALMEKEKITVWYSVPLALIQLLSNGLLDQRDLSGLRWVLFGGEVFAPKHLTELMHLWPGAIFCNVYGPAEINQCSYFHIERPPESNNQIPLGKIWFDAGYKILDEHDNDVKLGVPGELVVDSKSMMRGYWNNESLTKKSLYREIDVDGSENIYYRTGDLVYENESGNLVFRGRNDRQIKIRGYRVEMDEVEAVLSKHSDVEEAATFLLEDSDDNTQIGAAVILVTRSLIEQEDLKSYCKNHLPYYALPHRIEIMSEFPRTSSGKIKRSEIGKIIS